MMWPRTNPEVLFPEKGRKTAQELSRMYREFERNLETLYFCLLWCTYIWGECCNWYLPIPSVIYTSTKTGTYLYFCSLVLDTFFLLSLAIVLI